MSSMRKLFKSKLFWISAVIVLASSAYYVYNDVSYVIKQFYSTGSELFATLPQSQSEVPQIADMFYAISSGRKEGSGAGVSVFLIFYLMIVAIVATWRATRATEKKGKKIALRLASFVAGPIIGVVGGLALLLAPTLGFYSLAEAVILHKADVAAHEIAIKMKSEEGRKELGIISDEEAIAKRIQENPAAPVIINDDDSFTSNVIIAAATIGKDKTAFEAVAIPQAVRRSSGENVLIKELGVDQLLLPGHILAIRSLTPESGRKLLPIIGEKIIRQNKLMRAKISESGKTAPKYIFLTVEDYRKLREVQGEKAQQNFIDTINLIKGRLARGEGSRALLSQRLTEWEDAYQNYLSHPVVGVNELGTATGGSVQVLLVDEDNIPSDISGHARYFLSPLTATVHELMHYYSGNKADIPDSLEESMTGYYERFLLGETKILMDSNLSLDDFTGYQDEKKIIGELANKMSEGELLSLYFSGNQARFAGVFEQKYAISYEDLINELNMIFYTSSAEESEKSREELLFKLKGNI